MSLIAEKPGRTRRASRDKSEGKIERTGAGKTELIIQGKHVPVSNLDKVFYPKAGFTKGQVIDYYVRVAPVLLPHLQDRPLTLKRYPDGVEGFFFSLIKRRPGIRCEEFVHD